MRNIFLFFILTINIIHCTVIIQQNSNDEPVFIINNQTYLRGSNYIRLINASIHVLFEPDMYSRWDIETAMKQMHNYGYNYVRVFLSCPAFFTGFGLKTAGVPYSFTQNVVDFLEKAKACGDYLIVGLHSDKVNNQIFIIFK